jgi:hypothetical protein
MLLERVVEFRFAVAFEQAVENIGRSFRRDRRLDQ